MISNLAKLARLIVDGHSSHPINIIPNSIQPPIRTGKFGYNYGPKWRRMYSKSTIKISVGENWVPKIPKGMTLHTVGGLHLIRDSDGMDFHFTGKDLLLRKNFCTWARKQMAINYTKRMIANKQEKLHAKMMTSTYVNFIDARQAGNCATGIMNWAKRKLNIDESTILQAPWLYQFPAKLLYRLDANNPLVKNSINRAYMRETLVCI